MKQLLHINLVVGTNTLVLRLPTTKPPTLFDNCLTLHLSGVEEIEQPTPSTSDSEEPATKPFGKHRGMRLSDVPPEYYHWLWHSEGGVRHDAIRTYIAEHWNELVAATPKLTWKAHL